MNELDFSEITKLNEKFNKDPKSRIFVQLADLYRKNNMIDEALDVLNKGFEFHPQYPVAYLILGKCYYDKRSYIQARDAFEKTISFDPQNIVALRMLAKTCEILKDEKGQINAYKNIIAIDPLDANANEKLSMLEALQRKEPMYTVAMAEEYEKQGNREEALQIYEHLLYTDPSDLILKQKVTELKKSLSDEKRQIEEEKIADMKVEPVFQDNEIGRKQEPEKIEIETFDRGGQPTQTRAADEEIQSLEDFLVEELEQAAEKKAAEKQKNEIAPTIASEETAAPEPHVTERPAEIEHVEAADEETARISDAIEPVTGGTESFEPEPGTEIEQESAEEIKDVLFPESAGTEESPIEEQIQPPVEQAPQEEPPTTAGKTSSDGEPATSNGELPDTETQTPAQRTIDTAVSDQKVAEVDQDFELAPTPTPTEETKITEPAPPEAQPTVPEHTPPSEETDEAKKEEEPKKPNEEDFKSFQDWLSGLLK